MLMRPRLDLSLFLRKALTPKLASVQVMPIALYFPFYLYFLELLNVVPAGLPQQNHPST